MMTPNEKYAKAHDAWLEMTGLKKGDRVRVLRSAKDNEHGWGWHWTSQKEKCVGEVFEVVNVDERDYTDGKRVGCVLSNDNFYPFFILEVVEQKKEEPSLKGAEVEVKVNGQTYKAIIQ